MLRSVQPLTSRVSAAPAQPELRSLERAGSRPPVAPGVQGPLWWLDLVGHPSDRRPLSEVATATGLWVTLAYLIKSPMRTTVVLPTQNCTHHRDSSLEKWGNIPWTFWQENQMASWKGEAGGP